MEKVEKIWLDGEFVKWEDANIHVLTHTLHYGLGVFEGIRCYRCNDGRSAIFRLKEHTNRLFDSAHIVQIDIPFSKDEINNAITGTLKANNMREGYIRPLVFLGDGSMGLFPKTNPARVAIAVWPWGAYLGEDGLKNGIKAKISSFTRQHVNINMTKAKVCGNYVNSILAKREAVGAGFDEAIMLDTEGYISEASGENIFIVKDGLIKTTPLSSILKGITRDTIIRIAQDKGLTVTEERFTRDDLYTVDEAFFTGTAVEITPIREVDYRTIGEGRPGPVTTSLQSAFFDIVTCKEDKYFDWLTYVE
ncbi:MAG: branched-chain amino acid transaminase [Thermodesulfobacteriota bacterium]